MKSSILIALVSACVSGIGSFVGGVNVGTNNALKAQLPCPACNCPPTAMIDLGSTNFAGKINNKKGELKIEQTFDNVTLILVDSAAYRKALNACK